MKLSDIVESFDSRISGQVIKSSANSHTIQAEIGGRIITYHAYVTDGMTDERVMMMEFYEKVVKSTPDGTRTTPEYGKTGSGNQMQVFAFIIDCVKDSIIDFQPDIITFSSSKEDGNRTQLYSKIISRVRIPGYRLNKVEDRRYDDVFEIVKDDTKLGNFAKS